MNMSLVDASKNALLQWVVAGPLLEVMLQILPTEITEHELLSFLYSAGIKVDGWDACNPALPDEIRERLHMVCPAWKNLMTYGKQLLWQVIPHLKLVSWELNLTRWLEIFAEHGVELNEWADSTYAMLMAVRICVERYKFFTREEQLSGILDCILVLATGAMTERQLIDAAHDHGMDVDEGYMFLIHPLAAQYAEVLAQQALAAQYAEVLAQQALAAQYAEVLAQQEAGHAVISDVEETPVCPSLDSLAQQDADLDLDNMMRALTFTHVNREPE
jgi:hypothetical protein